MHVTILGSGSAGNCALVETEKTRLLIDGGLSARQMMKRLLQCGVNPIEIDAILVTHEHGDHTDGLRVWCKHFATPIYCNRLTRETLQNGALSLRTDWRLFVTGSEFSIKDIGVECFYVPHDAVDPVGFVLHRGRATLGLLTDLGSATRHVFERVRKVHTLVIETNHDDRLLESDTKRPWSVKQRIRGTHGHLSNSVAAGVVAGLLNANLRRVVLGHLSRDCNRPELAVAAVRERTNGAPLEIFCATQREVSPQFAVG